MHPGARKQCFWKLAIEIFLTEFMMLVTSTDKNENKYNNQTVFATNSGSQAVVHNQRIKTELCGLQMWQDSILIW